MQLSDSLLKEFASITNDTGQDDDGKTTFGVVNVVNGTTYVRLDGSEILTPTDTLIAVQNGDRVMVKVKNHAATITGNVTAPAKTRTDVTSEEVAYSSSEDLDVDPEELVWSENIPTVADGEYLWSRKITTYSDPELEDTVEYSYVRQGADGSSGNFTRTVLSASQALTNYTINLGVTFTDAISNLSPSTGAKADDIISFSASYTDIPVGLRSTFGATPGSSYTIYAAIYDVGSTNYSATVTNFSKVESGQNGEDATLIAIDSSRGVLFKNSIFSTVLTVHIFKGGLDITDANTMRSHYGNGAYLQWKWRKYEDEDWGTMLSTDSHISNNGFTLTVTPDDVNEKIVFKCELNT